jgi:hypothetical protein
MTTLTTSTTSITSTTLTTSTSLTNQPPAQVAASVADRLTATQCSVHTTQPWSALFIKQHVR